MADSLAIAVVPSDRKVALICPIFKKGDPEDVANYRQVSLTSVAYEVFERILKRLILAFLS